MIKFGGYERSFSERGYLDFNFFIKEGAAANFKVKIPFFENPIINESKQARLGKYKPIGRNSNLYSFLGAESTVLNLTFNMNLLHIKNVCRGSSLSQYVTKGSTSNARKKELFDPRKVTSKNDDMFTNILAVIQSYEGSQSDNASDQNFLGAISQADPQATKIKALYYFWTNIIRSSVIGTTKGDGSLPIVRLNFGPLYKKAPFIVERYQINIDEKSGYDRATLLPNRIKISLQMEELRVGDFGEYKPYNSPTEAGNIKQSENVAGWEHVLDTGSIQPLFADTDFSESFQPQIDDNAGFNNFA